MLAVRLKCLRAGLRQGDKGAVVSESAKGASVLHHLQAWRTRQPGPRPQLRTPTSLAALVCRCSVGDEGFGARPKGQLRRHP